MRHYLLNILNTKGSSKKDMTTNANTTKTPKANGLIRKSSVSARSFTRDWWGDIFVTPSIEIASNQ